MDSVNNFAKVIISTIYDASATSIVLSGGHGAKLPDPAIDTAFNLVWWDSTNYPDPADDPNVEIVRCTARTGDTLTVTRAQEGTVASTKNTGSAVYKMVLAFTKKLYEDLQVSTLNDLSDVVIAAPAVDEVLKYNGTRWVNSTIGNTSAGNGAIYYPFNTLLFPGQNTISTTPGTDVEQIDSSGVLTSETAIIDAYTADTVLGGSQIDAGVWTFDIYAYVDDVGGDSTIITQVLKRIVGTGTVTTTGIAANSRLARTTGTLFLTTDDDSDITLTSYLETENDTFQITDTVYRFTCSSSSAAVGDTYTNNGQTFTVVETLVAGVNLYCTGTGAPEASGNLTRVSGAGTDPIAFSAVVTTAAVMIAVPGGYSNESAVTYAIHRHLFKETTAIINNLVAAGFSLYTTETVQPAYTGIGATDRLSIRFYGKTTGTSITISYAHNGTEHYSHIHTPLSITVEDGGTGRSSHTAYAVICGGTTTTAAQQSIASVGTGGQVLTSNGVGALPTFQNAVAGSQITNIWLPAEAAYLPATNPAVFNEAAGATTYAGWSYLAFDDTTAQTAVWRVPVPDYDGGNIIVKAFSKPATTPAGDVTLQYHVYTIGLTDNETFDTAVLTDTTVNISHSLGTGTLSTEIHVASATIDPANVTADDLLCIALVRDVASDNLSGNGQLVGILLEYTRA